MKGWTGCAHDPTTNSCFLCTNPFSILRLSVWALSCLEESLLGEPASQDQEEEVILRVRGLL